MGVSEGKTKEPEHHQTEEWAARPGNPTVQQFSTTGGIATVRTVKEGKLRAKSRERRWPPVVPTLTCRQLIPKIRPLSGMCPTFPPQFDL
jgi:hypothetical protein